MGSLPDSKYIIQTDGYWFVDSHDVDSSKGYITVSAKGITNGLSNQPNDGADFGPDTYNPNYSGSGIPYTQTSGIQEAIDYANARKLSGLPSFSIRLLIGSFKVTSTIELNCYGLEIVGSSRASQINAVGLTKLFSNPNSYEAFRIHDFAMYSYTSSMVYPGGGVALDVSLTAEGTPAHYINNLVFGGFAQSVNMNYCEVSKLYNIEINDSQATQSTPDVEYTAYDGNVSIDGIDGAKYVQIGAGLLGKLSGSPGTIFNAIIINASSQVIDLSGLDSVPQIVFDTAGGIVQNFILRESQLSTNDGSSIFYFNSATTVNNVSIRNSSLIPNSGSSTTTAWTGAASGVTAQFGLKSWIVDSLYYNITLTGTPFEALSGGYIRRANSMSTGITIPTTATQNTNPYDMLVFLGAYVTSSASVGNIIPSVGPTSTINQTYAILVPTTTSVNNVVPVVVFVPAGWYWSVSLSNVTIQQNTVISI